MTLRNLSALRFVAFMFLLVAAVGQAVEIKIEPHKKYEMRVGASAGVELIRRMEKPVEGTREARIISELRLKPSIAAALDSKAGDLEGYKNVLKLSDGDLATLSKGYLDLRGNVNLQAKAVEAMATVKVKQYDFESKSPKKTGFDFTDGIIPKGNDGKNTQDGKKLIAEVFAREAALQTQSQRFASMVGKTRMAELLSADGSLTKLMASHPDAAFGKGASVRDTAITNLLKIEQRISEIEPTIPKDKEGDAVGNERNDVMREGVRALRDSVKLAAGEPGVLKDLSGMVAKFTSKDSEMDSSRGLGVVARVHLEAKSGVVNEEQYKAIARDNLGGGVSEKVITAEVAKIKAEEAKDFDNSKNELAAIVLKDGKKINLEDAKTMADLVAKLDAEIEAAKAEGRNTDLEILSEARDALHLKRFMAMMNTNPRFEKMDKLTKAQTVICGAKAAGKKGFKVLPTIMVAIGLPAAAWVAFFNNAEATPKDLEGTNVTKKEAEAIVAKHAKVAVEDVVLFAPINKGGLPSVSRTDGMVHSGKADTK